MQKSNLDKILFGIICSILSLIVLITVIGFATKKASFGKNLRDADPSPEKIQAISKQNNTNLAAYTGLGTIRVLTSPDSNIEGDIGTVVVLTPWLSYPEGDTVFFEELSRKRLVILAVINSYFVEQTKNQLLSISEEKIKADLISKINDQLSLGKISGIYFTDYMFLE